MKSSPLAAGLILAMLTVVGHIGRLPVSLEDLDSINFALGVRDFDVAQHQPHPPGYPVYIAVAKLVHLVVANEARALAIVSLLGAAAAAIVLVLLFRALTAGRAAEDVAVRGGALLAATSPLFWMTAVRPLSDMGGLAAALTSQWLALSAVTVPRLALAGFVGGLGVGVRSQVVWLTLPLLLYVALTGERRTRVAALFATLAAFAAGSLAWLIPLIVLAGGPAAYLQALAGQGGEDFSGVAMLATQPSPRLLLTALYATVIAPWHRWWLAVPVLAAAAIGAAVTWRHDRRALTVLAVTFGPYALFHLVFQETVTTRYALPLVVPVAFLAARGLVRLPSPAATVTAVALGLAGLLLTQPALRAYAATAAPAFRVIDRWTAMPGAGTERPVLAMHRRQELDMRRPLLWEQARVPPFAAHLPAPPKHEWLESVKYWSGGGQAPVWFLADPPRSDLRLIDPHALRLVEAFRWPFDASALLGGVRPNVMDFYEIRRPGWFAGEGWALTPETAGVARDEGKGPGREPIRAWVRRREGAATLMIGGRKLSGAAPTPVTVAIDGRPVWTAPVSPGFFLHFIPLPAGTLTGTGDYAVLTVSAGTDEVAIEQFDLQDPDIPVYGYGDGWLELEYNPATGRLWRWTTEQAVLRAVAPPGARVLHLEGEFETSAATAHVTVRAGARVLAEHDVPRQFTVDIPIPADAIVAGGETALTITSDQWYVPAETNWRPTEDRRHLALRVFTCELR